MNETRNSTVLPTETVKPEKLNLSATQVVASGMAAISSTVAASYFGVAGTVIGAAFGAVLTVVGNAVYGYYLRRTRNRVLDLAVSQRFSSGRTREISIEPVPAQTPALRPARTPMRWHPKRLAVAAAGLFVVLMAATTAFEFASGQPLSATVTGNHGSGVTFGGTESKKTTPTPASTAPRSAASSSSASTKPSSASPTVTVTVTPSASPSTSTSSTPTDSGSTSSTPSSSGSASTTPTPTPTPSGLAEDPTPAG